jgi:DNA-binding transcriptional ArsR family regulator
VNAKTQVLFEARAKIIKALAHPTRLFIVDRLSTGEACVADLTKMIGADMSTVSKHLTVLKAAGIVDDRKQGAQVYYALRVPCVMNFFGCVESILQTNADRQMRLVRLPLPGPGNH